MIKALLDGRADYTDKFADVLNKCTLCMTCAEHCPFKAQIPQVIVGARADKFKAKGLGFPYNVVFKWLLPHRTLFGNTVRLASWFQRIFMPKTEGTIRHLSFFLSALGKGRQIPSIAPRFLRQLVPVMNSPRGGIEARMRVGFFSGCMMDFVFPDLGKKIIDFLTKNAVEVVVPREQVCCGAPVFLGAGDLETGRKLADANVRAFADLDCIICGCATGVSALKDYAKFLADTPERAEMYATFGGKVKDISQFLVDVLKLPVSAYQASAEAKGLKVTWHDPCHLKRYLGVKEQPRQIIRSIAEVKYIEMTRPDWCCGMAGTFTISNYELSKKIVAKKLETIKAAGADAVVTGCTGCMIQFIDGFTRHRMPQRVMHIMELLE